MQSNQIQKLYNRVKKFSNVDRAVSSYCHYARSGQIPLIPLNEGLKLAINSSQNSPKYADILRFGLYYQY